MHLQVRENEKKGLDSSVRTASMWVIYGEHNTIVSMVIS